MKRYEAYKDSCIDWLGKIPEHWNIVPLKYLLNEKLKYGASEQGIRYNASLPRYIRITDFNSNGELSESNKLSLPEEKAKDFYLKDKDILFARSGATVGKSFIFKAGAVCEKQCCFAGYLIKAECNEKLLSPYFLYAYTNSNSFEHWKNMVATKATIENISADKYAALEIPVPSIEEQKIISTYVDSMTNRINSLISAKENQIKDLQQYRTSLITETVTRGLNPNVELKESGIDWLGMIPKHWEICRIKDTVCLINDRATKSSLKKIGLENIESATGKYIETDSDFSGEGIEFQKNDILFGKLRPYLAKVYKADFEGQSVGDIYVFRSKHGYAPDFLKYLFISDMFISVVDGSTYGAKMPRANWDFISSLQFAFPTINEQQEIATYLDAKTSKIDEAIMELKSQIEDLRKYKTSVISEAVTGKVDLREWTPN